MFGRSRSGARRSRRARSNRPISSQRTYRRKPLFELLEDRRMLAILTVNSVADNVTAADGLVTLREAILAANNDTTTDLGQTGSGADMIQFAPGLSGATINLSVLGELQIRSALTIDATPLAGGLTIKAFDTDTTTAGNGTRVFNVDDGTATQVVVSLTGLTMTGGDKGGVGAVGAGGAIFSRENLAVDLCTITGSRAATSGGGVYADAGLTSFNRTTISSNVAGQLGGGVSIHSGSAAFTDSTISGNAGALAGGGVFANNGVTILFNSCTISGNFTTGGIGGGIYVRNFSTGVTITNSTISGNKANGQGGGLYANLATGQTLTVVYSTITKNTSDNDTSGAGSGGGVYLNGIGAATIKNTIIAGNTDFTNIAPDIDNTTAPNHPTVTQMFNLVGNNKGAGAAFPAGALIGTPISPINPLLGTLTNNGGPTKTHALLTGSPAIDAGDPAAVAGAGGVPMFDQRDTPFGRVVDGDGNGTARLDIGAFEFPAPVTQPTMALLSSSDTGMFNNDNVTNKMQPAFGGVGPTFSSVFVFAQLTDAQGNPLGDPFVIGTGSVGADISDGVTGNNLGQWEVTVEPMADGKYNFFARFEQNNDGNTLSAPVSSAPQNIVSFLGPLAIPDGPNGVANARQTVSLSPMEPLILNATVTVNINHNFDGDLTLILVSPSGTSVLLSNRRGGSGDNYVNTVFSDSAGTSIAAGVAPFTGSFRPEQPLSALMGESVNGSWTLQVIDNDAGVSGTIVNWSLSVVSPIMVVIDTVAPNTPLLDLIDDTGRASVDNITKDNTPQVSMTSTDPNGQFAQLLFSDNLKFRIYDRYQSTSITGAPEVLIYDSAQDPDADAISLPGDMFTSLTQLTKMLPFLMPSSPAIVNGKLADGVHNLKLVVEDRAGNISHDFQLQITVDTTTPPLSFGLPDAANATDGLIAASDSGVTTVPATYADRITNVTTPTFWGRAEANSIVRLYYDKNADGKIQLDGPNADIFLGQTTAIPLDGNDAYPNGYWEIRSALDLNQIVGVPKDGLRRLLVTAEDVAGNPTPTPTGGGEFPSHEITTVGALQIFIDTQGPQVTAVTPNNSTFILFALKPTQVGPTPLVNSLKIAFKDLPSRVQDVWEYDALVPGVATAPGNYVLVGDHVGIVAIQSIQILQSSTNTINGAITAVTSTSVTAAGFVGQSIQPEVGDYLQVNVAGDIPIRRITAYDATTGTMTLDIPLLGLPTVGSNVSVTKAATATVTLTFAAPLPDDRYTLTVKDNLVDAAGNKLDGESHQAEPQPPLFPSGDGVPGGNFVARFTVDSRPELGNDVAQNINIDINGNFVWDPANSQIGNDATNVDLSFTLPVQSAAGAVAPGGFNVHDLLFAGKFLRPNAENGAALSTHFDQLAAFGNAADLGGVFRWIIDTNSDGVVTIGTDINTIQPTLANFNVAGAIPIAGNFDGNAANGDEIGLYNAGKWFLDTNHNFVIGAGDTLITSSLLGAPIVGDFDGDGKVDLAVFNNNQFFFNLANDGLTDATDATITWGFPGVLDKPVAADMDGDGITDIGLWVPRTDATLPQGVAQWYFLVSNDFTTPGVPAAHTPGSIAKINHAFSPTPFGHDIFAEFGDERSLPIVGNFDPPLAAASVGHLGTAMGDYDGNGRVEQADYNLWTSSFGSTSNLAADGNGNGIVDSADYSVWRDHLGAVVPGAGGGAASLLAEGGDLSGWSNPSQAAVSASSTSVGAELVASSLMASPAVSARAVPVSSAATSASNAEQVDQALLLLLSETPPTVVAKLGGTSITGEAEEPTAQADALGSDADALSIAWQTWGDS